MRADRYETTKVANKPQTQVFSYSDKVWGAEALPRRVSAKYFFPDLIVYSYEEGLRH